MKGLVQSHEGYTAVGLEFPSFCELALAVPVDFSLVILTSIAHVFPPPSLGLDSQTLTWCSVVDLCIWI